jgi:hypothetical protein
MNMVSKTPQFDKALDEYFAKLELDEKGGHAERDFMDEERTLSVPPYSRARRGGQWRTCRFSGEKFYVRPEDVEFYKKIRVPLPTLSPSERIRRRLAYAPGYEFSKVKSGATGKEVVTVYSPRTPFKIYEHHIWFSPEFDPSYYAAEVDLTRTFFDQWRRLQLIVPRPNLNTDHTNVNSDYTNNSFKLKNCYFTFDALEGENLYYFECCERNKECVDCWSCNGSDSCYQSWGDNLFKCFFVHNSQNCLESYFLFDCRNCEHCFMSSNLRNKKYCFFNEQLTKEEYEKQVKKINLGDYRVLQKYIEQFRSLRVTAIRKPVIGERAINSYGSWIFDSRDCYYVHYAYDSERVAYSIGFGRSRDSYDLLGGNNSELCYELSVTQSENNYGVKFSSFVNESRNLEYCDLCRNCHDCFGCIGLTDKSFCIFNKQYTEEEYWKRIDEIKTVALRRGEYGEFFPPEYSPFPYNFSIVSAYPGYEDIDVARRYGYQFEKMAKPLPASNENAILSEQLPPDIKNVDNSILNAVILDTLSQKKFRIAKYELDFYRMHNFPLPRTHPIIRMAQWRKDLDLRLRFYDLVCAKCGKAIQSMYAPDRPEKNIWCESCYLKELG